MAAKKSPSKKKTAPKAASVTASTANPSRLTWALAITFTVLSVVFVVQAFYYYA